jgi:DNA-binding LytR/AlgR family response regulator
MVDTINLWNITKLKTIMVTALTNTGSFSALNFRKEFIKPFGKENILLKEPSISLPISCKKTITVAWKDISHLEAISNYTMFYFNNGKKLLVSRTMKDFLAKLDAELFVRVHKSFAINLNYLIQFDVKEEMFVQLKDGKKISVSRRKKKDFLEKTRNYMECAEIA